MTHNRESYNLEEILAGYVLGNLEEEETIWLKQQLLINPELEIQIKELETSLNLMPYGLSEEIMPAPDLRQKIITKNKPLSNSRNYSQYISWLIGGITTLSTLWFGINNYDLRQQLVLTNEKLRSQQELFALMSQPNNRLVSLTGSQNLPDASGSLFVSPQKHRAILKLKNLKPLGRQEVYRLWTISGEEKIGCISFTPDENGQAHIEFSNNSLEEANAILITIESEVNTLQPNGNAMITGYL